MITGEGGILGQTKEAKNKAGIADLKESIMLDILEAMTKQGGEELSKEQIREILVKYFGDENVPQLNDSKWDNFPEGFIFDTEYGEKINIAEVYNASFGKLAAGTEAVKPNDKDWEEDNQPSKEDAIKKITENFHPGEIMLLHGNSKTNTEILPEIIKQAREQGYEFYSLDQFEE